MRLITRRTFVKGLAAGGAAATISSWGQPLWAQTARAGRTPTRDLSGTDFELHDSMASAWLFVLQPHRPRKESADLLHAEAFSAMVQSDSESWHQALVRALDMETVSACETMADGGVPMPSVIDLLGARGMHRLAARYLQNSIR